MSEFDSNKGRVIQVDGGGAIRAAGIGVAVIAVLILSWASLAYVPAGHVGVLTRFGRVTSQVLAEGTHFVNPFAVNNTMSIRTQTIKETASVPSNEGLLI